MDTPVIKPGCFYLQNRGYNPGMRGFIALLLFVSFSVIAEDVALQRIRVSENGKGFEFSESKKPFVPWGFNYLGVFDHLAEEDWETAAGWARIEKDFKEMRKLEANVIRWHLQFETFMKAADQPNAEQLARLKKLLKLARENQLYLDLTGLNCFRLKRIPAWYDALSEQERWKAQAVFWEAIAETCAKDPIVFCYDLMNEPVIGEPGKDQHPWLGGELGGFHFVQRICNKPAGRENSAIGAAWVKQLVEAIKKRDPETLVTVGIIPWALVWPNAKDPFYTSDTSKLLDFVSVHVYPKTGGLEKELAGMATYDLGKPIVIEEFFPMHCSLAELDKFVQAASKLEKGKVTGVDLAGSEPLLEVGGIKVPLSAVIGIR